MKYVPADCCSGPGITPGATSQTPTSDCGSAYGSGLRMTPLTTLKISAFAPMAAPTVMIAVSAKAGLLRRRRRECFTEVHTKGSGRRFRTKYGVRAVIGKGGMGAKTLAGLKQHGAVYLSAIGGAAQFYALSRPGGWRVPDGVWNA